MAVGFGQIEKPNGDHGEKPLGLLFLLPIGFFRCPVFLTAIWLGVFGVFEDSGLFCSRLLIKQIPV